MNDSCHEVTSERYYRSQQRTSLDYFRVKKNTPRNNLKHAKDPMFGSLLLESTDSSQHFSISSQILSHQKFRVIPSSSKVNVISVVTADECGIELRTRN